MLILLQSLLTLWAFFSLIIRAERTPEEGAVLARKLVHSSKLGQLATIMSPTGPTPDIDGNGSEFLVYFLYLL